MSYKLRARIILTRGAHVLLYIEFPLRNLSKFALINYVVFWINEYTSLEDLGISL